MNKLSLPVIVCEGVPDPPNRIFGDDINNRSQQTFLNQDTKITGQLMEPLEDIEAISTKQRKFGNKIRETILAIDSELNTAVGRQHRELLVKAIYTLRNLEDGVQRSIYR